MAVRLLVLALAFAVPGLAGCASDTRVIRRTPASAIIAGEGDSRIEAELAALKRAREMFPEFHETREMECSQEYRGTATGAIYPGAGHLISESRGYTFWQCVVFIEAGANSEPAKSH